MSAYDHYAEARGESLEGQEWVGHVIMNRTRTRSLSIAEACLQPYQFECWNGRAPADLQIREPGAYEVAKTIVRKVMNRSDDPTDGCNHYNCPDKEGYPAWTRNVAFDRKIGNHQFYKPKKY